MPKNQSILETVVRLKEGGFNPTRSRWLVYGESGTGKSTFASSFPEPILFLDMDDGLASIRKDIDALRIETWDDLYEASVALLTSDHPYKTVVVDSLNEAQRLAMKNVLEKFPDSRRPFGSQPSMTDWGKLLSDLDDLVRGLKSLDCHVVFIAQVQPRQYETDIVQPQLSGKNTVNNIARMMDFIGYIYVDEVEGIPTRSMVFDVPNYLCKDRSGMLPPVFHIQERYRAFEELSRNFE